MDQPAHGASLLVAVLAVPRPELRTLWESARVSLGSAELEPGRDASMMGARAPVVLAKAPGGVAALRRGAGGAGARDRPVNLMAADVDVVALVTLKRSGGWYVAVAGLGLCNASHKRHGKGECAAEETLHGRILPGRRACAQLARKSSRSSRSAAMDGRASEVRLASPPGANVRRWPPTAAFASAAADLHGAADPGLCRDSRAARAALAGRAGRPAHPTRHGAGHGRAPLMRTASVAARSAGV